MPPTMSIPWLKLLGGVSGYGVAGLVVSLVVVMKLSRPSKVSVLVSVRKPALLNLHLVPSLMQYQQLDQVAGSVRGGLALDF